MRPSRKSRFTLIIVLAVFALSTAWVCFRLGTHRHTGILRTLAEARRFFGTASGSPDLQQSKGSISPGPQHRVNLSWKASTSAVVGYNVYRRGTSGTAKLNAMPVTDTSYVDSSVQPGQTYYYVTKAVSASGAESSPSNEVQVAVPSP